MIFSPFYTIWCLCLKVQTAAAIFFFHCASQQVATSNYMMRKGTTVDQNKSVSGQLTARQEERVMSQPWNSTATNFMYSFICQSPFILWDWEPFASLISYNVRICFQISGPSRMWSICILHASFNLLNSSDVNAVKPIYATFFFVC